MLGSPVLGVLFGIANSQLELDIQEKFVSIINTSFLLQIILFLISTYALAGHIYAYNGWAGMHADKKDKSKTEFPLIANQIKRKEMQYLSIILLSISLIGYTFLDIKLVGIALINAFLWFLYCDNRILWKSKPILGSLVHLITGVLNFLLGYSLFSSLDLQGVVFGLFFAIIFVAGHLNHEIRDYNADLANGYKTTAISFGKQFVFCISIILFTYSHLHLFLIHKYYHLDIVFIYPLCIIYPLYIIFAYLTWKGGLDFEQMDKFRTRYRILFAIYGLYQMVYLIFKIFP